MRRLLVLLIPALFVLAGCGGGDEPSGDSGSSAGGSTLNGVTITGKPGSEPKVTVDEGFTVDETTSRVVSPGGGTQIAQGSTVLVDYVAVNAKTGNTFDSSYQSGQPETFTLAEQRMFPGIIDALVGKQAGDRVAAAIPPSQLFGQQGNPQAQIGANDTVVFVFDVEKVSDPNPRANVAGQGGQGRELPAGLPQLALDDSGTPTGFQVDRSTETAPEELGVHTLVEGDGEQVQAGDLLTVHYLGQIYPDGKIFDQSYTRGAPTTFQVGAGALIPAWDKSLVGLREGSRVVLVVPPAEGYGSRGEPQAGIKGSDTLLFVIDVLGTS